MKRYPRVLIVTKAQIGDMDSAGAALRGWFGDWPRTHLAQIYSGTPLAKAIFCERTFHLGPEERAWGRMFFRLKRSSLGDSALPYRAPVASAPIRPARRLARELGRRLIDTGLWELVFRPRLSPGLRAWVADFNPDVVFAQGCDLTFLTLPLLLHRTFGTPVHFDIVDDWVRHIYRSTSLGSIANFVVQRRFRDMVRVADARHVIGPKMAEVYAERYGARFDQLMQCDNAERFISAVPRRTRPVSVLEIVYSGSLALKRWKGLLDLVDACRTLRARGLSVEVTAYVPFVPQEAAAALRGAEGLRIEPAVADADVPAVLAGADLLFLPESFDSGIAEYISLSLSTKAHLYMFSGRPALVYGPAGIGTVEYARRERWAHVVDCPGVEPLCDAIERLARDSGYRATLVERSKAVRSAHHDAAHVRERLRKALLKSAGRLETMA